MKTFYLGSFPPPYGGVTVKNEYLFQSLHERMGEHIEKIDTQAVKRNPALIFLACCKWFTHPKKRMIVATAGTQRRRITLFLNRFQPSMLGRTILMVMGGNFAETIADDAAYCRALQKYRKIYVETRGMAAKLHALGILNTAIFPNCRKRPDTTLAIRLNMDQKLKCVFFSQVSLEKGIDIVLEAAKKLTNVCFDIWGGVLSFLSTDGSGHCLSTD